MARSLEVLFPAAYQAAARRQSIDLVHLAHQTLGDWALECEVLRMFEEVVTTYFGRVRAAETDDERLMNLHALRGAALGVGAFRIAELCKLAEGEVRQQGALADERVDDIAMAIEEARVFIESLIVMEEDEAGSLS